MGNSTNEENWAAQERLRAIEKAIWWRGWMKRKDLVNIFGVSLAQASSDIQKYLELNPNSMTYQLNRKRYEATDSMTCALHTPLFEDAVRSFLDSANIGQALSAKADSSESMHEQVAVVSLPNRTGSAEIQRAIMSAFLNDEMIKLRYWSVSSGKASLRNIVPRRFGHDGYRWHVRAWCCDNDGYRDFVLSRVSQVKETSVYDDILAEDTEWNTIEVVKLKANSKLEPNAKRAIEMDYGIRKNGTLKLEVRTAMKHYLLSHLRVSDLDLKNHFELA